MARLIIGFEDDRDRLFAKYLQTQSGKTQTIAGFWNEFNEGKNGGMTATVNRIRREYGSGSILACTAFVAMCAESGAQRI